MCLLRASLISVLSYYSGKSGTYCSVTPDQATSDYLNKCGAVVESMGFTSTSALNHHVTLAYSQQTVSKSAHHNLWAKGFHGSTVFKATPSGFTHWPGHDGVGYVVLTLDSPMLKEFNRQLVNDYGLSGNFPDYNPHLTIATDVYGEGSYAEDLIKKLNEIPSVRTLSLSGLKFEDLKD